MKNEGTGRRTEFLRAATSTLMVLCLLAFFSLSFPHEVRGQAANDQDEDGMDDTWEETHNLNSSDPSDANLDPDQDGLTNREEFQNSTDPGSDDTDSDGMPDGWEVFNGLDPLVDDSEGDRDNDGLPNLREFEISSDPNDIDDPGIVPAGDDDDNDSTSDEGVPSMGDNSILCMVLVFIFVSGFIVLLVGIGIYSKIKKDRLMDHETRQRIVDYLNENPGAYYTQIRKDLDLAHGVLTHHINMLEQQDLLFSKQDRSYRRFYLDGMHRKGPIVVGKQKEVLDMVTRYPGSSQSEIGRRLDMGRMIVSYHINQLEDLGLIFKIKHGRENLIHPVSDDLAPGSKEASGAGMFGVGAYGSESMESGEVRA